MTRPGEATSQEQQRSIRHDRPVESHSDGVLLAPVLSNFDATTTWGRKAAKLRVVETGSGCEVVSGDETTTVGLPTRPAPGAKTLSRVVYVQTTVRVRGNPHAVTYLMLVDSDDRVLAVLGRTDPQYAAMSEGDLARVWPRSGFAALEARGVTVSSIDVKDIDELARRHPGSVTRSQLFAASSTAWRIVGVLVVGVPLLLLLIGRLRR